MSSKFSHLVTIRNRNVINGLPTSDPIKLIELLDKIGVIKKPRAASSKTGKKQSIPKSSAQQQQQERTANQMYGSSKSIKMPETKKSKEPIISEPEEPQTQPSRFPARPIPAIAYAQPGSMESIQNMNKMIADKQSELKQLQTFNNPQFEEIKKKTEFELAGLKDAVQRQSEALSNVKQFGGYLGGAIGQIQQRIERDILPGISKPVNPFEGVKGSGDAVEFYETDQPDTEEQEFTNQGSQDIPETVLNVDVSPAPEEIVEENVEEPEISLKQDVEAPKVAQRKKYFKAEMANAAAAELGLPNPPKKTAGTEQVRAYLIQLGEAAETEVNSNLSRDKLLQQINQILKAKYDEMEE